MYIIMGKKRKLYKSCIMKTKGFRGNDVAMQSAFFPRGAIVFLTSTFGWHRKRVEADN